MSIADYDIITTPAKYVMRFQLSEFNSISNSSQSDCSINKYSAERDRRETEDPILTRNSNSISKTNYRKLSQNYAESRFTNLTTNEIMRSCQ